MEWFLAYWLFGIVSLGALQYATEGGLSIHDMLGNVFLTSFTWPVLLPCALVLLWVVAGDEESWLTSKRSAAAIRAQGSP